MNNTGSDCKDTTLISVLQRNFKVEFNLAVGKQKANN